jgi:Mn2+/Fe2+ NRAMP family transporter
MYFIILTTAFTLHAHHLTAVSSTRDVIVALQPVAGPLATLLFAIGLIGVGFLAIPILAGSAAYAFSEIFRLRHGLDEKLGRARAFYGIMGLAVILGVALTFTPIKPVDALYLTAVINGVLAPPLLAGILLVACDRRIMRGQPSSPLGRWVVGAATAGMGFAAVAFFAL